jgi:hypothetical protein
MKENYGDLVTFALVTETSLPEKKYLKFKTGPEFPLPLTTPPPPPPAARKAKWYFILDLKLSPCTECCTLNLGDSPASEFYMPTFRSTLLQLHSRCK